MVRQPGAWRLQLVVAMPSASLNPRSFGWVLVEQTPEEKQQSQAATQRLLEQLVADRDAEPGAPPAH